MFGVCLEMEYRVLKPYYQDEWVTIYHGDCIEVLSSLPEGSMDLIIADPPYNLGKKYGEKSNDSRDPEEYWKWFETIFTLIHGCMRDGYLYISHSDRGAYLAKPILETIGLEYIQTLIWWARNGYSMQLHRRTWSFRHEPILFLRKGTPACLESGEKGMWYTSVIEVPRPQSNYREGRCHITQKPVNLYKTLIARTPGEIALDPCMGVGTSLVAAKALYRKCIGIEIEEKYCEIAAKRCSQGVFNFSEVKI